MRKIFTFFCLSCFVFSTFLGVSAYSTNNINSILEKYYYKLDNKVPILENRILKLESIHSAIKTILVKNDATMSESNRKLLLVMQESINKQILLYRKDIDTFIDNRSELTLLDQVQDKQDVTTVKEISMDDSDDTSTLDETIQTQEETPGISITDTLGINDKYAGIDFSISYGNNSNIGNLYIYSIEFENLLINTLDIRNSQGENLDYYLDNNKAVFTSPMSLLELYKNNSFTFKANNTGTEIRIIKKGMTIWFDLNDDGILEDRELFTSGNKKILNLGEYINK